MPLYSVSGHLEAFWVDTLHHDPWRPRPCHISATLRRASFKTRSSVFPSSQSHDMHEMDCISRGAIRPRWHRAVITLPTCYCPRKKHVQPFSQESRTATAPKVFQFSLCGVVEADLELCCNSCCSAGLLGEQLYVAMTMMRHNPFLTSITGRQSQGPTRLHSRGS